MAGERYFRNSHHSRDATVITHAVTKGLDPHAPMKDSGIEWLGKVPAHWEVVPTAYRYDVQLGRMLNGERAEGDDLKPYLRVFDVQWGAINIGDLPVMDFPPDSQMRYRLKPGDLLVNEGGSYIGRSAIWHGELDECYYQKALHRLRPHDRERDTARFFILTMEVATKLGVFIAGPVPGLVGIGSGVISGLNPQAKPAVSSRRRRQRHDHIYNN